MRWTLLFLWLLTACCAEVSSADENTFRVLVLPILQKRCFECHSHSSGSIEGGLALDWKSGWEQGGSRGPAIVPGSPDSSLIMKAVRHTDPNLRMPEQKLPEDEIAILQDWILKGAFDDRIAKPGNDTKLQEWWSLNPLIRPELPASASKSSNPIDAFVEQRLSADGLDPVPLADRRTLIRRAYFDLTGLPPTFEDVNNFVLDMSSDAWERVVDRLLQSPRYGERWARHWFDTIHFAESHGYEHDIGRDNAWPYRDYVIRSFNDDKSWDRFIREQLAVDAFEPESTHLLPALGFISAGTFDLSTYSTGPVTFDYLDRDDMVTQTMAAFTSTTANCARCHAHKFDPISQEDYYSLQAVFSGVLKGDIAYDTDQQTARERVRLNKLLSAAQAKDPKVLLLPSVQADVAEWIEEHRRGVDWHPLRLTTFVSSDGATLTRRSRDSNSQVVLASGEAPDVDTYTISGTSDLTSVTAIRLDVYPDSSLPMNGPGRCHNGNLHLSEISVHLFSPGAPEGRRIELAKATADFNQEGWGIHRAIDGDNKTAWGIYPNVGMPHHAVFEFTAPITLAPDSVLTVTLRQLHGGSHLIGAFGISTTDAPAGQVMAIPEEIKSLTQMPAEQRNEEQHLNLSAFIVDGLTQSKLNALPRPSQVYAIGQSVRIPAGNGTFQDGRIPTPKPVHILRRGDINKPDKEVSPGSLSALTSLPARFESVKSGNESLRRAALADWIAHPENVLTWRSITNRVWHYHFGAGICDTPSDFGRMGGIPTHPELLDWLAIWFRDDAQGSLKHLHRLILTSDAWCRDSSVRARPATVGTMAAIDRDSDNRLIWRHHRTRLDADQYKDAVLKVSGSLDLKMFGPSVQHFSQSPGPQATPTLRYSDFDWTAPGAARRSIYRYVWRGIADPFMEALDFPDLGLLAPSRGNSTSSLQALAVYNNSFVLHFSECMARDIAMQFSDPDAQAEEAVNRTWLRPTTAGEKQQFADFISSYGLPAFCRVLLNSNEFLYVD
ncbi:MAG: PSD1 and planctomycete cytochrome C domain-containing protein [Planctomycetaceae bacterium]